MVGDPARAAADLTTEIKTLVPEAELRTFAAGQVIFRAGDNGDGFYVVESGRVRISAMLAGNEPRVLATIGPGDSFGEMAVLDDAPRSATAEAEVETRTLFVGREKFVQRLAGRPALVLKLIRELSARMRALNHKYIEEIVQAERLAVVGRFAAAIVHDFKNPLTIIGLAAETACSDETSMSVRHQAQARIARQVERMTNMLQELIEYTRPSGQQRNPREIEFARYMHPLLDELRPEVAARRVTLVLANAPPRARVRIDPPRLSRLFHNLISNAVEAMGDGGEVRLHFRIRGTELRIDVQDTGPGIAPEIADTLFSPFATHGKPHGTGLGLTICRKIAQDHGGRMWAESVPGQGATFSFTLPVAGED